MASSDPTHLLHWHSLKATTLGEREAGLIKWWGHSRALLKYREINMGSFPSIINNVLVLWKVPMKI